MTTPWTPWHGGVCPLPPDTLVEVRFRDDGETHVHVHVDRAGAWDWAHYGDEGDIQAYRTGRNAIERQRRERDRLARRRADTYMGRL